MSLSSYPVGYTTASRLKTLVLWLRRARSEVEGLDLLRQIEVEPEYLLDETRPVGLQTLRKALALFSAKYGREVIGDTWSAVLEPDNLGVWVRVLRGAFDTEGALSRLSELGGDEPNTVRWETLASSPGHWRGRVTLAHDPALEADGFLSLARIAEVTAVPAMFGHGAGTVRVTSAGEAHGGAPVEELDVTWKTPSARGAGAVATGLAVGSGAVALAVGGPRLGVGVAVGSAVAGVTALVAWARDQQGKADSNAQRIRIRALERSVALKEERERAAIGFIEGSVIANNYRLGPKLGSGASGVIHRATRLDDNAQVAIKLLRTAAAQDAVATDRLKREAEALGLAWHPNVVQVYEHGVLPDGTSYLAMEYLQGESLAQRLRTTPRLPAEQILDIARQICDALVAIHKAGIIHRDLKPGNIFLVPVRVEGDAPPDAGARPEERVKLLDFGIARVEWADRKLTQHGAALGTPGYMSPEQEKGDEIDVRSDIFALGAVLYECLTGQPPPTSSTDLWRATRAGGASGEEATIPRAFRPLLERAMDPVPRARFRDARSMREAIDALADELSGVPPVSSRPSVRKTSAR